MKLMQSVSPQLLSFRWQYKNQPSQINALETGTISTISVFRKLSMNVIVQTLAAGEQNASATSISTNSDVTSSTFEIRSEFATSIADS